MVMWAKTSIQNSGRKPKERQNMPRETPRATLGTTMGTFTTASSRVVRSLPSLFLAISIAMGSPSGDVDQRDEDALSYRRGSSTARSSPRHRRPR